MPIMNQTIANATTYSHPQMHDSCFSEEMNSFATNEFQSIKKFLIALI
jgi:hypothetical protein